MLVPVYLKHVYTIWALLPLCMIAWNLAFLHLLLLLPPLDGPGHGQGIPNTHTHTHGA